MSCEKRIRPHSRGTWRLKSRLCCARFRPSGTAGPRHSGCSLMLHGWLADPERLGGCLTRPWTRCSGTSLLRSPERRDRSTAGTQVLQRLELPNSTKRPGVKHPHPWVRGAAGSLRLGRPAVHYLPFKASFVCVPWPAQTRTTDRFLELRTTANMSVVSTTLYTRKTLWNNCLHSRNSVLDCRQNESSLLVHIHRQRVRSPSPSTTSNPHGSVDWRFVISLPRNCGDWRPTTAVPQHLGSCSNRLRGPPVLGARPSCSPRGCACSSWNWRPATVVPQHLG